MAYELYSCDFKHSTPYKGNSAERLEIKCERIAVKLSGWKNAIQWNVATLGKVKVYTVYDKGKIIHSSYVVWGNEKFRFLKKGDIEIGPCWTHTDYRGHGIYPTVLSHILQQELSGGGTAYMIIRDDNTASQRGVSKAGFQKSGDFVEKDSLKRYQIVR